MSDKLNPGQYLPVNGSLTSQDGRFTLIMQADGNLVLYGPVGQARWASGTGTSGSDALMQADGNFVIYGPQGALWYSGTDGHPGASLIVQNDGNVVVYDPIGNPLWASANSVMNSGVEAELNSDLGAGHFMETGFKLLTTGELTGITHTYTVTWFGGFTGAFRALFIDEHGVIIGASEEVRFGVDGRRIGVSDRTDRWKQDIDPAIARRVKEIRGVHYWAPKVKVDQMIDIAIQVGLLVLELISQLESEPATDAG